MSEKNNSTNYWNEIIISMKNGPSTGYFMESVRERWKRIRVLFFRFGILVLCELWGFLALSSAYCSRSCTHFHWLFLHALAPKGLFPNANIISSNHSNIYEYKHPEPTLLLLLLIPFARCVRSFIFHFYFMLILFLPVRPCSHAPPYRNDMHLKFTCETAWLAGWRAFDQIFRHACTIISSTEQQRINSTPRCLYKRVSGVFFFCLFFGQ